MSEGKKGFIMYADILDNIEYLSMEERGLLFTAILCDQSDRELPELTGAVRVAFSFIKQGIDRNTIKYNAICEKRRQSGLKGGRPPKETKENQTKPKETKRNQTKPNETNTKAKKPDNREQITDNREQISDNGYQKTDNREQISEELSSSVRKPYGKYQNVFMTDDEYKQLLSDFPESAVTKKIEKLSAWLKRKANSSSTGLPVRQWLEEESVKEKIVPDKLMNTAETTAELIEVVNKITQEQFKEAERGEAT